MRVDVPHPPRLSPRPDWSSVTGGVPNSLTFGLTLLFCDVCGFECQLWRQMADFFNSCLAFAIWLFSINLQGCASFLLLFFPFHGILYLKRASHRTLVAEAIHSLLKVFMETVLIMIIVIYLLLGVRRRPVLFVTWLFFFVNFFWDASTYLLKTFLVAGVLLFSTFGGGYGPFNARKWSLFDV